jgi:O-antigen ligase/tetratricopeptide (TPR) repeat protein
MDRLNRDSDCQVRGQQIRSPVAAGANAGRHETKQLTPHIAGYCLRAVDYAICTAVFLMPLFLGGRYASGHFLFVIAVVLAMLLWLAGQLISSRAIRGSCGLDWVIVAATLLIVMQLLPWPRAVLEHLSPGMAARLPLWDRAETAVGLRNWQRVSFAPIATQTSLSTLWAYGGLLFLIYNRIRAPKDWEIWLQRIAIATVALAALGIAQFAAGNGKFLWVYSHPVRDVSEAVQGPYDNENHFAQVMALGLGPLLYSLRRWNGEIARRTAPARLPVWGRALASAGSLAVVLTAGLLTFSRGGMIALGVAAVSCLSGFIAAGFLNRSHTIGLIAASLLAGTVLAGYDGPRLAAQLQTLAGSTWDEIDHGQVRRRIWAACLQGSREFPILGVGVGAHAVAYETWFEPKRDECQFDHAENGYLQILFEAGLAGITILVLCLAQVAGKVCTAWRRLRSADERAAVAAIASALLASCVQSGADFVWYIPGCMALTVLLAGLLFAIEGGPLPRTVDRRLHRWNWGVALGAVLLAAVLFAGSQWGSVRAASAADQFLACCVVADRLEAVHDPLDGTSIEQPDDGTSWQDTEERIALAEAVIHRDPADALMHVRLARLYLMQFDQCQQASAVPLGVTQIREAALASRAKFQSLAEQNAWLDRVVGDSRIWLERALRHARQGLRLCPLLGEGYVTLAEVAFMEGYGEGMRRRLVGQALAVRPRDGSVLYFAGSEAALRGDIENALRHWREAGSTSVSVQRRVLIQLDRQVPVDFLLQNFSLDVDTLGWYYAQLRGSQREDEWRSVGVRLVEELSARAATERGSAAAHWWREAETIYRELGQTRDAIKALQRAVLCAPERFDGHRSLGYRLMDEGEWEAARSEFEWCLRRHPDDDALRQALAACRRQRLPGRAAGESEPAAGTPLPSRPANRIVAGEL